MLPSMCSLNPNGFLVLLVQLCDVLKVVGVTGNEGTFTEKWENIIQIILCGKGLDIGQKLRDGDAGKRVLDSARGDGSAIKKGLRSQWLLTRQLCSR